MKRLFNLIIAIMITFCLVACNNDKTESTTKDTTLTEKQTTTEYEGRIKSLDFTVIDLTDCVTNANDDRFYQDSKSIDEYRRQDKVKLYYLDEINEVYYITLDEFAGIFKNELKEGVTSTSSEADGVAKWTVTKDNKTVYSLELDAFNKTMTVESGLDVEFVKSIYNGKNGVDDDCDVKEEYVEGFENTPIVYGLERYDFDIFEADGKYCYPFALLSAEFSKVVERSFIYLSDYQEIVEYGMIEQIQNTSFLINEKEVAADNYIDQAFINRYAPNKDKDDNTRVEPEALRIFNRNLLYFIMDSYYGIAKEKGIESMTDYFENFALSNLFLDEDSEKRGSAYNKAFQMLNDLHSGYSYSARFSESASSDGSYVYSQTFYNDRSCLNALVVAMRNETIKKYNEANNTEAEFYNVRYSKDNKYAYFSFDGFTSFNYFGSGDIPENEQLNDSFYLFVKNLNEAKAKGVKRVIIDDSCNGGGYVTIMGKLLALMSKDNKSEMYISNDNNNSLLKITTRVDSNKDGVYDENDCFGNDFEFYIVTSNYSFSCGNAFPFYAQAYGLARIVGNKSGGGECAVFNYSFPTGQGISYSSPYHIGYYNADTKVFSGDEGGAIPNYGITDPFFNIYDVDVVAERIELVDKNVANLP